MANRLFEFSVRTIKFLRSLSYNEETNVIRNQLIKSATSAGANYEESQAGSSRADFGNKVRISLREMRESNYWLRLLNRLGCSENQEEELFWLMSESEELMKILGAINQKTK